MSRLTLTGAGGPSAVVVVDSKRVTGLLYAYELEESSGTRYSFDGHGPDLDTVVGTAGDTTGIIGQAFLGDGSSNVEANDVSINTTLDGLANFTISFWYKHPVGSEDAIQINWNYLNPAIAWSDGGAYFTLKLYVHGDNRYNIYGYWGGDDEDDCLWHDGNWHHGLYTFDGSQISTARIKAYFDGVDMDGMIGGRGPLTNNCPVSELDADHGSVNQEMQIGSYFTPGYEMDGSIDHVAMWNYTMTQEQVEYEYNSGAGRAFTARPAIDSKLTSGYALEESTGTRVDFKGLLDLDTAVSAPSSATGIVGNALSGLEGSEYVSGTGATAIYHGLDKLSINYWLYADTSMSTFSHTFSIGDMMQCRHQGNGSNATIDFRVWFNNSKYIIEKGSISIGGSAWRMFTITYDGSLDNDEMGQWYLDGVLQDNGNPSSGLPTTTTETTDVFYIGCANLAGQPMTGGSLIDQFSTYADYVLTLEDVELLYNSGAGRAFE